MVLAEVSGRASMVFHPEYQNSIAMARLLNAFSTLCQTSRSSSNAQPPTAGTSRAFGEDQPQREYVHESSPD
jgi:hypothetical protein